MKSSKIKVVWRFALRCDNYKTREVVLKHSLLSGKREIRLDQGVLFNAKKVYGGSIGHSFCIHGCQISVVIEDTPRGYTYDLHINQVPFYRNPRICNEKLERLRSEVAKENLERVKNRLSPRFRTHEKAARKRSAKKDHVFTETYSPDKSLFSNKSSPQLSEKSDVNQTDDRFPDFELPKGLESAATHAESVEFLNPSYNADVLHDNVSISYAQPYRNFSTTEFLPPSNMEKSYQLDWSKVPQDLSLEWAEESKEDHLRFPPEALAPTNYHVSTSEATLLGSHPPGKTSDPFAYLVNLDDIRLPAPVDYVKHRKVGKRSPDFPGYIDVRTAQTHLYPVQNTVRTPFCGPP